MLHSPSNYNSSTQAEQPQTAYLHTCINTALMVHSAATTHAGMKCCPCMVVQNGQSIISGWSDGKIRAFGPQSGKLLYTIHDAHQGAVTAISGTPDSSRIISGGEEGMVRMWAIHPHSQVMQASMKVSCAFTGMRHAALCCRNFKDSNASVVHILLGHAVLLHKHDFQIEWAHADHAVLPNLSVLVMLC